MGAYCRDFDETKYMSFEINDGELFENTKKLGKKVKNSIKKNFKLKQHTTKNI